MNSQNEIVERIKNGYTSMGTGKRAALFAFVFVIILVALFGNTVYKSTTYEILYKDIQMHEAAKISNALDEQGIDHTIKGTTISVPKKEIDKIRLSLASQNLIPESGSIFENYLENIGLGTTESDRKLMRQNLLESSLARTISSLETINNARVHLVIAEDSIWANDDNLSSASVILELAGLGGLNPNQISAIQSLVSGAIPNLASENVQIIDTYGNLLTVVDNTQGNPDYMNLDYQMEYKLNFDRKLQIKIEQLLTKMFGINKFTVALSSDIDFSTSNVTEINYDDEGVLRSEEQIIDRTGHLNGNDDSPVGDNTEPDTGDNTNNIYDGEIPTPGDYMQTIKNWEISETTTNTILVPGKINSISVSVVLDQELSDEDKLQIENILKAAIGFDDTRGDVINVEGFDFPDYEIDNPIPNDEEKIYFDIPWLTETVLLYSAAGLALFFLLFILFLLMSLVFRKKKKNTDDDLMLEGQEIGQLNFGSEGDPNANSSSYVNVNTASTDKILEMINREEVGDEVDIEGKINALRSLFIEDISTAVDILRVMIYDNPNLSDGYQQAAEILIIVGSNHSSEVLNLLTEDEMLSIVQLITSIKIIPTEQIISNIDEYLKLYETHKYIKQGGVEYARQLLEMTVGESHAEKLINRISSGGSTARIRLPFKAIRDMSVEQIISIISSEHPQTIALILSYIDVKKAAQVLSSLAHEQQIEVSSRISTMKNASSSVIETIEDVFEDRIKSITNSQFTDVGGIPTMVDILNAVERSTQKNILNGLELVEPELAQEIRDGLFVFDDIIKLSDTDIQRVLRDIEQKTLAIALKGVSDEINNRILKNISKRAKDLLLEEIEYLGPLRVSEIEVAQGKIVSLIRDLDESGEITISQGGEDDAFIY